MKPLKERHNNSIESSAIQKKYDVFISYSRKDRIVVLDFAEKLKNIGFNVWIDYEGIHSSDDFKSRIVEAINDSTCFVFFSSANSNNSQYTIKEVGVSVQLKKHIIPIKLDDTAYAHSILFDLVNIDYVDATQHDMDYVFKKVAEVIALYCGRQCDIQHVDNSFTYSKKDPKIRRRSMHTIVVAFIFVGIVGIVAALVLFNKRNNSNVERINAADSVEVTDSTVFYKETNIVINQESTVPNIKKDTDLSPKNNQKKSVADSIREIDDYNRLLEQFYKIELENPSTRDLLEAQDVVSQMLVIEERNPKNPLYKQTVILKKSLDGKLEKKSNDLVQYAYDYCLRANNDSAAEDACIAARKLKYTEKVKQLEKVIEQRKNSQKKTH